jgi:hypothetical protein
VACAVEPPPELAALAADELDDDAPPPQAASRSVIAAPTIPIRNCMDLLLRSGMNILSITVVSLFACLG